MSSPCDWMVCTTAGGEFGRVQVHRSGAGKAAERCRLIGQDVTLHPFRRPSNQQIGGQTGALAADLAQQCWLVRGDLHRFPQVAIAAEDPHHNRGGLRFWSLHLHTQADAIAGTPSSRYRPVCRPACSGRI
jgi:hypothetical protein